MPRTNEVLRKTRESLQLSSAGMARLLCVEERVLAEVEAGERSASPQMLEHCARLMGVTLREFLTGKTAAPAVLYRRVGGSETLLSPLQRGQSGLLIGGFVRDVSQAVMLNERCGRSAPELPSWAQSRPIVEGSIPPHDAEALAGQVRRELGLGLEPIRSVWALAEACGVVCATATPDLLDRSVDGLSWRSPSPGLIVNLVGGAETWWRTRMTVMHELAHVWFDLPDWGIVISMEKDSGVLYEHFEALEQRANAFAAYMLMPPEAIREMAAGRWVDTALVAEVSSTFGVGFEAAVHTICNVLNLPWDERMTLLMARGQGPRLSADHPDRHVPPQPRERLAEAVERALEAGVLSPVQARVLLGLKMSAPLPAGWARQEPVLRELQRVRNAALRMLRQRGRFDVVPDRVERLESGDFRVLLAPTLDGSEDALTGEVIIVPGTHAA